MHADLVFSFFGAASCVGLLLFLHCIFSCMKFSCCAFFPCVLTVFFVVFVVAKPMMLLFAVFGVLGCFDACFVAFGFLICFVFLHCIIFVLAFWVELYTCEEATL